MSCAYRLQLGPLLGFADACELVPYLQDLGVTHLYLSPVLQASRGSEHGYDVVDPSRVSESLGGAGELRRLCSSGLDVILDVVPNHMRKGDDNPYWADPRLRRQYFDIDPATGGYRRFFDVDDLAGVLVEDEAVFRETHRVVLSLVEEGLVDGLRVDHVDGLADPARYLARLSERGVKHIWVEKILQPGEALRDWPVEGTTGYDFLNDVNELFIDPAGEEPLTRLWEELAGGDSRLFGAVADSAKFEQASTTFAREVEWLARDLGSVASEVDLARALSSLPVYRTYVEPCAGKVDAADRDVIQRAGVPEALARILTLDTPGHDASVTRFQQMTGPVMAKGVEDTAFYRYNRLIALNEVGGHPGTFGITVEAFHARNAERARRFPLGLLTTHTHDTKRSGDVRARIGALSWRAEEWCTELLRWRALNVSSGPGPDPSEEYFIYQTLVGAWPIGPDRLVPSIMKAIREAKRNTSWVERNAEWEESVDTFCRGIYDNAKLVRMIDDFAQRVAHTGERSSLGQLVLKLTSPGLPDIYQGDELWSLQLVDPDNRGPVDYAPRREALAQIVAGAPPTRETLKLFVTHRILKARAKAAAAFHGGSYTPLPAGTDVCAFLRGEEALVVVSLRDQPVSGTITLPESASAAWESVLTGIRRKLRGSADAAELLETFPADVFLRPG